MRALKSGNRFPPLQNALCVVIQLRWRSLAIAIAICVFLVIPDLLSLDFFGVFGVPCFFQPAPKYHTKGCSRSFADSPGARTLVFAAFEPFHSCEFRASIARTPFCAILWRSPSFFFFCEEFLVLGSVLHYCHGF